LVRERLAKWPL